MVQEPKKKRRNVTLIEIMIVIVLIGLIGGVLAYNMRGSLDEGRAFKTKQSMAQIENILMLAIAEGKSVTSSNWKNYIDASPLVKKADELTTDGWKNKWDISIQNGVVQIKSAKLDDYEKQKTQKEKGK